MNLNLKHFVIILLFVIVLDFSLVSFRLFLKDYFTVGYDSKVSMVYKNTYPEFVGSHGYANTVSQKSQIFQKINQNCGNKKIYIGNNVKSLFNIDEYLNGIRCDVEYIDADTSLNEKPFKKCKRYIYDLFPDNHLISTFGPASHAEYQKQLDIVYENSTIPSLVLVCPDNKSESVKIVYDEKKNFIIVYGV